MKSQGTDEPARRQHDRSFKAELVRQSLQPGASVAAIALQNGINANLLFKWKREHRREAVAASTSAMLVPVQVVPAAESHSGSDVAPMSAASAVAISRAARAGVIELEIAGAHLRLRGAVDEASLCSVLRALRQST